MGGMYALFVVITTGLYVKAGGVSLLSELEAFSAINSISDASVEIVDFEVLAEVSVDIETVGEGSSSFTTDTIYAHCEIVPDKLATISGTVDFRQQPDQNIEIKVNVSGLNISDGHCIHGLHVHMYGDLSDACDSFEGHWDPFNTVHGAPFDPPQRRHPGDFGNLPENADGTMQITFTDYFAALSGTANIAGHGMVLHEHFDDLGRGDSDDSLSNGNAGSRYGCCVIAYSDDRHW